MVTRARLLDALFAKVNQIPYPCRSGLIPELVNKLERLHFILGIADIDQIYQTKQCPNERLALSYRKGNILQILDELNPSTDKESERVTLQRSPEKGRYVTAAKDAQPGNLLTTFKVGLMNESEETGSGMHIVSYTAQEAKFLSRYERKRAFDYGLMGPDGEIQLLGDPRSDGMHRIGGLGQFINDNCLGKEFIAPRENGKYGPRYTLLDLHKATAEQNWQLVQTVSSFLMALCHDYAAKVGIANNVKTQYLTRANGARQVNIVATKHISQGEELSLAYGSLYWLLWQDSVLKSEHPQISAVVRKANTDGHSGAAIEYIKNSLETANAQPTALGSQINIFRR